ncbi:hypothetical protein BLGI_4311 [Brevibacillus laterosporus GI-9]|nr:hypothetical protein BLGI_4311 [Brevibacillus laterosporus GI-9]
MNELSKYWRKAKEELVTHKEKEPECLALSIFSNLLLLFICEIYFPIDISIFLFSKVIFDSQLFWHGS